jgi:hypothetical protein
VYRLVCCQLSFPVCKADGHNPAADLHCTSLPLLTFLTFLTNLTGRVRRVGKPALRDAHAEGHNQLQICTRIPFRSLHFLQILQILQGVPDAFAELRCARGTVIRARRSAVMLPTRRAGPTAAAERARRCCAARTCRWPPPPRTPQ